MAFNFPANPVVGQVHVTDDYSYAWDGEKWTSVKRQYTNVFNDVEGMKAGNNMNVGDWCKTLQPYEVEYTLQHGEAEVQLINGLWAKRVNSVDSKSANNLHSKRESVQWTASVKVVDPLQLYVNAGVEYLPNAEMIPFTTNTDITNDFRAGFWRIPALVTNNVMDTAIDKATYNISNNMGPGPANIMSSIMGGGNIAMMLVGDSITEGVGATSQLNAYERLLRKSLGNITSSNYACYPTSNNMKEYMSDPFTGASTDGTLLSIGPMNSRLMLSNNQSLHIHYHQAEYFDVIYNGFNSSGTLGLYLNDELQHSYSIESTSESSVIGTFPIGRLPKMTNYRDKITFKVSGRIEVIGVRVLREGPGGPIFYRSAKSGWAYQNFNSEDFTKEATSLTKMNSNGCTYVVNLGTNNLYNSSYQLSPDALMEEIHKFVNGITSKQSNSRFIISVPPEADSSKWPLLSGYKYSDYVSAYMKFSKRWGVPLIRHDLVDYVGRGLYSDGVHPNDFGHIQMARTMCDALGVPFHPSDTIPDYLMNNNVEIPEVLPTKFDMALSTGILEHIPGTKHKLQYIDGVATLNGVFNVAPDAPVDPSQGLNAIKIGTVPGDIASMDFDKFFVVPASNGFYRCRIAGTSIEIQDVVTRPEWVSLCINWIIGH